MIWFIIEHWFWIACVIGYVSLVTYVRITFGQKAAWAVATAGGAALAGSFVYRKGRDDERQRQQQQAERARQYRQEAEQGVGAIGEEDVQRELGRWNRD